MGNKYLDFIEKKAEGSLDKEKLKASATRTKYSPWWGVPASAVVTPIGGAILAASFHSRNKKIDEDGKKYKELYEKQAQAVAQLVDNGVDFEQAVDAVNFVVRLS